MHFAKVHPLIKPLAGDFLWSVRTQELEVFLTFDDGPIPEVTPYVLDILEQYNAKATFFCVGKNAAQYPELLRRIANAGHTLGNHTFDHENGWKTPNFHYLRSVLKTHAFVNSRLFRPPYGRISRHQALALKSRYTLVMWDVLSGDYNPKRTAEQCLQSVVQNTRPGSIVVFHDSLKAAERVLEVLPKYLHFLREAGYTCVALPTHTPIDSIDSFFAS
jgi:peptidoglycan/xylan/chitin deacetylase (PgdA/CDA1 family)